MPPVAGEGLTKICSEARSIELMTPVCRSRMITKRSFCEIWIWWPRVLGTLTRVSTRAVTPLIRATSPLVWLQTQEAAS
jgi:hypothetical protein